MAQDIDYGQVEVPGEKPPEEYHYTERRAEILQLVLRAGGPPAVNQSTLAERYQVDPSTISRDLDRLSDSISSRLGQHIDLTVKSAFDKAVSELHSEGEHTEAFEVSLEYARWLGDRGAVDTEPVEVEHSGGLENTQTVELGDSMQEAIRQVLSDRREIDDG